MGNCVLTNVKDNIVVTPATGGSLINGAFIGVTSDQIGSRRVFPVGKLEYVQNLFFFFVCLFSFWCLVVEKMERGKRNELDFLCLFFLLKNFFVYFFFFFFFSFWCLVVEKMERGKRKELAFWLWHECFIFCLIAEKIYWRKRKCVKLSKNVNRMLYNFPFSDYFQVLNLGSFMEAAGLVWSR